MAANFTFFLLFFLPLVVIPFGISPFEGPKVILAEILILLLLILRISRFNKAHLKNFLTPQIIFVGILLLLSLDTSLLFQPEGAFFGNVFRLQGQLLFWHLLLFSLISKDIKLHKISTFFYYFSFICLFMGALILGVDENRRAFGTLGEPNALAATTLFIFPFVWFYSKTKLRMLLFSSALIIILLSGSRAGLIGFSIELIFLFLTQFIKISALKAVLASLFLIISSLFLPFLAGGGWFENRAEIWETSFKAGLNSPLIGHGFGNIQQAVHQTSVELNNNVQYQIVDSSHNFLLDFWVQGGIVGVISILFLISLTFGHFIAQKKLLEMTAFLGLIVAMLFNPVSVVNLIAFWWLVAQGFDNHHSIS